MTSRINQSRMRGGAVLGCGQSKCVVTNFPGVGGDYVTAIFQYSIPNDPEAAIRFNQETNPAMLAILNRIDPHETRFVYATLFDVPPTRIVDLPVETQGDIRRAGDGPVTRLSELSIFKMRRIDAIPANFSAPQIAYIRASVAMLHANGIAHGDIKRDNLGMRNGNVVLIDFGLAELRGSANYETLVAADLRQVETLVERRPPSPPRRRPRDDEDDDDDRPRRFRQSPQSPQFRQIAPPGLWTPPRLVGN